MKHYWFVVKLSVSFAIVVGVYVAYCWFTSTNGDVSVNNNTDNTESPLTPIHNSDNDTTYKVIDDNIQRFLHHEYLEGGAVVAISYHGRLVYAKGYGFSNVADSVPMEPYNRMRVASVSKLITATAIMRLIQQNRICLHQKVFGNVGVLNNDEYLTYKDRRMGDITVYQLLNHSGGWLPRYGDPMFMSHTIARLMGKQLPIDMHTIIRFMQDKSMHFTPGTASVYSNFGYGILGEVVAKASSMPYETYVRSNVLAPLGIYDMQIGYSHKSHCLPREVVYYEPDTSGVADYTDGDVRVPRSYGGVDIQTLGSAGGWVASATDLLKLTLTIDGFDDVPDQLSAVSIDTMIHRQVGFDPLGWRGTIGDSIWYRTGTLAATSAIIERRPDNICFVVLLNTSRGPNLALALRRLMDTLINSIDHWPDIDLWQNDEQWQAYKRGLVEIE
ncbi:MAG: beta-lactamase family protein [Bacteroidales bacterium]|nr:beta-lactamase family protein [Bacteroidales bacterium]